MTADNQTAEAIETVEVTSGHTMKDRYMTFFLGEELYGFAIENIIEIVGIQSITVVPDMPAFVKGVINLRGKVIPVLDVRLRFGMEEREYDDRTCIMVSRVDDVEIGLIVDSVDEVKDIEEALISNAPEVSTVGSSRFISGIAHVGESIVVILEVTKLLFEGMQIETEDA